MKIIVTSCWNYRDAWAPFLSLLKKFWPNHPPVTILTDVIEAVQMQEFEAVQLEAFDIWRGGTGTTYCGLLADFIEDELQRNEPIVLFQEDFFLSAPVQMHLILHALHQLRETRAGCVRLYPCPGGEVHYGDPYFSIVPKDAPYRISCQAAIWRPTYLAHVAKQMSRGTAGNFELEGTLFSAALPETVLAFKREVEPWTLEYICSAISRGKWNPDAKRLCDLHGITVDWSMRPFDQ